LTRFVVHCTRVVAAMLVTLPTLYKSTEADSDSIKMSTISHIKRKKQPQSVHT